MDLEPLLASIAAQGRAEIDRVRLDADATVHARHDAAEEAAVQAEAHHARVDPAVEHEARRRRSAGAIEASRIRATAGELAWRSVHHEICARLAATRADPDHAAILEHLLEEGLAVIPAPAAVRVHPADAEVAAVLARRLCPGAHLHHDLDATGVELADHAATVRVRCTLEDRLDAAQTVLRRHLDVMVRPERTGDADAA